MGAGAAGNQEERESESGVLFFFSNVVRVCWPVRLVTQPSNGGGRQIPIEQDVLTQAFPFVKSINILTAMIHNQYSMIHYIIYKVKNIT